MEDKAVPSSSSTADRKRKRVTDTDSDSQLDNVDEELLSLEKSLTFSDTLVALRMMRAQFPKLEKVTVKPFILHSQLYSSVKDRTQVDHELELLKRDKVLRVFKLNTGQDDHAVMFFEDYIQQVDSISKKIGTKKESDFAVFGWFKSHVLTSKLEPSISHQELIIKDICDCNIALTNVNEKCFIFSKMEECSLLSVGGKMKDEYISLLVNAGVITRQLIDPNVYWFAIPNIGSILKGISQGRKELLSLLSRRKYKEMMLALLEKKRRFSPLDMRFHLRDLIGSGHLRTCQTPTGIVVRVLKD